MKRTLKTIMFVLFGSITLLIIAIAFFVNLSPEFGGEQTEEDRLRYSKSPYYKEGVFVNQTTTDMNMSARTMANTMVDFMKGVPNGRPDFDIPVVHVSADKIAQQTSQTRLIWFGHSAFLLQIDGKNILLDPMLGEVPAPHPWLGGKRFAKELPIEIDELPEIDAILISHDHYDHLDYGSIQKLKHKTETFYVPLGVKAHFLAWGVPSNKIVELDWWKEAYLGTIKLAFTPSRHFSGRGLTDRFTTLWGSWVIKGEQQTIYFSGDGGYGAHFKEIGEKYGPFDFAMLECGQYNKNWRDIHMMPEETAQAAVDVQAKLMMPIHWGAFTLALHSWTDPIERVSKKAEELDMPLIAPKIGEEIILGKPSELPRYEHWWINPN